VVEFLLSLFAVIFVAGLAISAALIPIMVVFKVWEEVNRIKGKK
jgi:hypothetical protein